MMWLVYKVLVNYDGIRTGQPIIEFVTVSGPLAKGYAEGHTAEAHRNDGDHYQWTYQEVEVL